MGGGVRIAMCPDVTQTQDDQSTRKSEHKVLKPEDLRFLFVQFLFGLAAAEVGSKAADLFLRSNLWTTAAFWPVLSHLVLAMVLIGTSWVGWSNSLSSANVKSVTTVFSLAFIILLMDVLLVILYYMLVRSTGLTGLDQSRDAGSLVSVGAPALIVMIVFFLYVVWDVLTKWKSKEESWNFNGDLWKRGRWSGLCFLGSIGIWLCLRNARTNAAAELTFIALVLTDLSFRAFKNPIDGEKPWTENLWKIGWLLFIIMGIVATIARFQM